MKPDTLELLRCPACRAELALRCPSTSGSFIDEGILECRECHREFAIDEGIPRFFRRDELSGLNRRFARFYDYYSLIYRPLSILAGGYLGGERKARRELLQRLDPATGTFLEVSVGSGRNLPVLLEDHAFDRIVGVDISLGQLKSCQRLCRRRGFGVELLLAMGEALPFADDSFDTILHVGGINFFSGKQQALEEAMRVARPGGQILVADETERAARIFEWLVPGFSRMFAGRREPIRPPVDLLPGNAEQPRTEIIWRGMAYCLRFRKAESGDK